MYLRLSGLEYDFPVWPFDELGRAVDRNWTAAGRQVEAFPTVAQEAIRAWLPDPIPSLADVAKFLGGAGVPEQQDPHNEICSGMTK